MIRTVALCCLPFIGIFIVSCESQVDFQNGDIVFQISSYDQSKAIQMATNSKYSHVGLVYKQNGNFYVYEAVQPVKLTPINDWIERGENGHFVLKRVKDSDKILTDENLAKMKEVGKKFLGKDYDLYFEWSNSRIYCSELVWKIYKEALGIEIGKLQKLKDFDLTSRKVKKKLKERYKGKVPYEELVISPAAIFNSKKLVKVYER